MRGLVLSALLVVLVTACGSGSETGTEPASEPAADLTITNWPNGQSGPSKAHVITCPGAAVCRQLAALPASAFDPVPADMACTEIYGGPEEARVLGTIDGRQVDAMFKRTNGCEIARWSAVAFLLQS